MPRSSSPSLGLFTVLPLVTAACLVAACGGSSAPAAEAPTVTTTSSDVPAIEDGFRGQELLDAAGDEGAATVFFHPRHWSVLLGVATSIAGDMMPNELQEILGAAGPWDALRAVARGEGMQLPPSLAGWDDSRPLVVSLFEAPETSVAALLAQTGNLQPPDVFSHRAVIPATDPNALLLSLLGVARTAGCQPLPASVAAALPGPAGAAGALRCDDAAVIFDTGDGWVRMRVAEVEIADLAAGPLARDLGGAVAITPARRWAMTGPVVIAAHARPSRIRRALLAESSTRAGRGRHYANPAQRLRSIAFARAEILGALLRTAPVGSEVDDITVGLVTGLRPSFTVVQGLTAAGMAAYDAGLEAPAPPEGPPDAPFVIHTRVNVDAMQAAAGVPFGWAGASDPDAIETLLGDCSAPCVAQLLTSRIFGLGALADQVGLRAGLEEDVGPLFHFAPADLPPGVTMTMTFDLPELAERMDEDMFTRRIAESLGVIHVVQARDGRTLMTNVRLGETPPLPEPAAFTQGDPGPTDAPLLRTESAACVENTALLVEGVVRALGMSSLSNRDEVIRQGRQILDGYGACADARPQLRELGEAYGHAFEAAVEAAPPPRPGGPPRPSGPGRY
ncbi:MAG: hypothetical protein JRH11_13320 [Deltaproteobacteria bacterium]|nr:hypothetical protein [Deltaproteobacteria bacterium]